MLHFKMKKKSLKEMILEYIFFLKTIFLFYKFFQIIMFNYFEKKNIIKFFGLLKKKLFQNTILVFLFISKHFFKERLFLVFFKQLFKNFKTFFSF
jgi:hypothetical protein